MFCNAHIVTGFEGFFNSSFRGCFLVCCLWARCWCLVWLSRQVLTVFPTKPSWTGTWVVINTLGAFSTISTRRRCTFINVDCTPLSSESWSTRAFVIINQISAHCAISTRKQVTIIHIFLAQLSNKSRNTTTGEVVHFIDTGAAIATRIMAAVVIVHFTVWPTKAWLAMALESYSLVNTTTIWKRNKTSV